MEIIKTNLALTVTCTCGGVVAATMIYGNVGIDAEFTETIAQTHNKGGKIELVNTDITKVTLSGCKCNNR